MENAADWTFVGFIKSYTASGPLLETNIKKTPNNLGNSQFERRIIKQAGNGPTRRSAEGSWTAKQFQRAKSLTL